MGTEIRRYAQTLLFAEVVYLAFYFYLLHSPSSIPQNNAVANTAVFLMGASMILSGLCYFWNLFDRFAPFKKYLGLVGFAFAVTHVYLYIPAFMSLFSPATWGRPFIWVLLTGLSSLLIFTVMALISNNYAARKLGGKNWKLILRTGYIALLLAGIHILLLSRKGWVAWYNSGFDGLPALNLIISVFIVVVLGMRIALWIALKNRKPIMTTPTPVAPSAPTPQPVAVTQPVATPQSASIQPAPAVEPPPTA